MFLKINAFEHKTEKWHESSLLCLMAIAISVSTTFSDKITVELAFPFNLSLDRNPKPLAIDFETLLTEKVPLRHTHRVFLHKKKSQ